MYNSYELEKAVLADSNDNKIDEMNEQLERMKERLAEAVHHISLKEILD